MSKIEFIAYDGGYPNLCHGNLILKIDGNLVEFNNVLESGGQVGFDENWEEYVLPGDWSVDLSLYPEYEKYEEEITRLVNANVRKGCCGGCI